MSGGISDHDNVDCDDNARRKKFRRQKRRRFARDGGRLHNILHCGRTQRLCRLQGTGPGRIHRKDLPSSTDFPVGIKTCSRQIRVH